MPTIKDNYQIELNRFKGLGQADAEMRDAFLNRNSTLLKNAKSQLLPEHYNMLESQLYNLQLWQAGHMDEALAGKKPTKEEVDNYIASTISGLEDYINYAPDFEEDGEGGYKIAPNNTGFSLENWDIYNKLDEQGKKEFREQVAKEPDVLKNAKIKAQKNFVDQNTIMPNGDLVINTRGLKDAEVTDADIQYAASKNNKKAEEIHSKSLRRLRESDEYKSLLEDSQKEVDHAFDINQGNPITRDTEKSLIESFYESFKGVNLLPSYQRAMDEKSAFVESIQDNRTLNAATGDSFEDSDKVFSSFRKLIEEEPEFMRDYIAQKATLGKLLEEGTIDQNDYYKSLEDFAAEKLREHESWGRKATNAFKGAWNTAQTYSIHKIAPFAMLTSMISGDGNAFLGTDGTIYSDSDIFNNGNKIGDDDSTYEIYKDDEGNILDYKYIAPRITEHNGELFVNEGTSDNPEYSKITKTVVKDTHIGDYDLWMQGKRAGGEDVDNVFNEKYLNLSEKYNVSPFNRDALDYYDKVGYSKYVNVADPYGNNRDFWGETIKMMGFVMADLAPALLFRLPGAFTAGATAESISNIMSLTNGALGAVGIGDSYSVGVFEENLNANKEKLEKYFGKKAEDYVNFELSTDRGKKMLAASTEELSRRLGRELTPQEVKMHEANYRNQLFNTAYEANANDPSAIDMYKKAIDLAGTSSAVDFVGESLKYGLVNSLGFRKWLYNTKGTAAASDINKMFGKNFRKTSIATAEDVAAGKASRIGERFYSAKTWGEMSPKEKGLRVLGITGNQMFGGAWTNFTDEMQSWGSKEQNNMMFDSYLDNKDQGAYMLLNAITGQLRGIEESVGEGSTWWAGLIGGAGSVLGVGFNPAAVIMPAISSSERARWNSMSTAEKISNVFQNGIVSNLYESIHTEEAAQELLKHVENLQEQYRNSGESIINMMQTAYNTDVSELAAPDMAENNVMQVYSLVKALRDFSKDSNGLLELDENANLKKLNDIISNVENYDKLSAEEKRNIIETIKTENGISSEEDAAAVLNQVKQKVASYKELSNSFNQLFRSKEYLNVSDMDADGNSKTRDLLEKKLYLEFVQKEVERDMKERESQLSGGSLTNISFTPSRDARTYGTGKNALEAVRFSYRHLEERMNTLKQERARQLKEQGIEDRLRVVEQELLKPENKNNTELKTERDNLMKDMLFYKNEEAYLDRKIASIQSELSTISQIIEENDAKENTDILTAEEILKLDPISRYRMMEASNSSNYSKEQNVEIEKARESLAGGMGMYDVYLQAYAASRYNARKEYLGYLNSKDTDAVVPSRKATVANMMEAADNIRFHESLNIVKKLLSAIDSTMRGVDAETAKTNVLKQFSASTLNTFKNYLDAKDASLIESIMDYSRHAEAVMNIISDPRYAQEVGRLTDVERVNLGKAIQESFKDNTDIEGFYDDLAKKAQNSISLDRVLDVAAKAYKTSVSTVLESAREKANRLAKQAEEERLKREAEKEVEKKVVEQEIVEPEPEVKPEPKPEPKSEPKPAEPKPTQLSARNKAIVDKAIKAIGEAYTGRINEADLEGIRPFIEAAVSGVPAQYMLIDKYIYDHHLPINTFTAQSKGEAINPDWAGNEILGDAIMEAINESKKPEEQAPAPQESIVVRKPLFDDEGNFIEEEDELMENPDADPNDSNVTQDEMFEKNVKTTVVVDSDAHENKEGSEERADEGYAPVIKGNVMYPWIYESTKEDYAVDAKHGYMVKKSFGESMQKFNDWLDSRGIKLQDIIDDKLADILATGTDTMPVPVRYMVVNPTPNSSHNEYMENHLMLVVKREGAIEKVYTEKDYDKYGKPFIFNGDEYIPIGVAGWATDYEAQKSAYMDIKNSVKKNSKSYFNANTDADVYVDGSKYTHVAWVRGGFLTKQTVNDSSVQYRKLSELIADESRNPYGLKMSDITFGYQKYEGFAIIGKNNENFLRPSNEERNVGNVYFFVKGANGKYTAAMIRPTRYSEMTEDSKLQKRINESLIKLTNPDHSIRLIGLKELFGDTVVCRKDMTRRPVGPQILIGTKENPSLKFEEDGVTIFESKDVSKLNFADIVEAFKKLNPRISITGDKLSDSGALKELDEAGALMTDLAKLGKSGADFAVYNIGKDGRPRIVDVDDFKPTERVRSGETAKIIYNGRYYTKKGNDIVDESGTAITDRDTLSKLSLLNEVNNSNSAMIVKSTDADYIIINPSKDSPRVIRRERSTYEPMLLNNDEALGIIKTFEEKVRNRQEEERNENINKELESAKPAEQPKQAPVAPESQPVSQSGDVDMMQLLGVIEEPVEKKVKETPSVEKKEKPEEIKPLIDNEIRDNSSIFTTNTGNRNVLMDENYFGTALDAILEAFPELEEKFDDMTIEDIANFLDSKNKTLTVVQENGEDQILIC